VAEYILDSIRAELRQTIINNKWDESHRVDIAIALGEVKQNIESLKEALNQITDKTEQNHIYGEALIDTIVTLLVILTKYRGNMFKTSFMLDQLRDRLGKRTQHVISVIGKQALQTQVGGEKATNATS
jgi:predicted Zn-dependent protease